VLNRFAPFAQYVPCSGSFSSPLEERFDGLVADEEERCAGGGADEGGADTGVDAAEAARGVEAGGGLEAGF